ncbi:MAG: thioredoxin domain-containing protein [Gammaproteobacteria bacterium]|nr:thioredoxin domain-containing protein [Gammaproteobacteria bacterium]
MSIKNTLHTETSPYLLQHASNPVHWQTWNQNTLQLAKELNKPILLSIGYSACHWCHVMAHESFENKATADLMNEHFINIKVDREERPDLDKIYQTSHSLLTGRPGGWPLTVFLSPNDQIPFFAGTYFPVDPQHGLPAFSDILSTVETIYKTRSDDIQKQNESLIEMLQKLNMPANKDDSLSTLSIDLARKQIESAYDQENGGFSKAPKFPHPSVLERLLNHHTLLQEGDETALNMAAFSLEKMATGGFFDQPGGGFYRYSTDEKWMIPHFEKMLYDNAQLLHNYSQAYQITKKPLFKEVATKIANWTIKEMLSPEGGFYSAIDADTDGQEGKFYTWKKEELQALLPEKHFDIFAKHYGLNQEPNFEGQWHLHSSTSIHALQDDYQLDENELKTLLDECHSILYEARKNRTQPEIDKKILTSWNALMIRGLAYSGRIFDDEKFFEAAYKAAFFIKTNLWVNKRLLATCKDNKAYLNAYLDDYAYLLQALLELLQCRWDNTILEWTEEIADTLLNYFEDKKNGGFFFTSHDHEYLIQRTKSYSDDAMPSGNAICAQSLTACGYLLGKPKYISAAENCLLSAMEPINQNPLMNSGMINALANFKYPSPVMIIRGNENSLQKCKQALSNSSTDQITFFIDNNIELTNNLSDKSPATDLCIYICQGMTCKEPLISIEQLNDYLNSPNETN